MEDYEPEARGLARLDDLRGNVDGQRRRAAPARGGPHRDLRVEGDDLVALELHGAGPRHGLRDRFILRPHDHAGLQHERRRAPALVAE